jgi:hypothetical protein
VVLMLRQRSSWVCLSVVLSVSTAKAQGGVPTLIARPLSMPVPAQMRVQMLASNVALGAVVGGVRAAIARRSVIRGIRFGAIGGGVTGAARQLVGTRTTFAGVAGRVVHGVGLGLGNFAARDSLELPLFVGPIVARWMPQRRGWPRIRVNALSLGLAPCALLQPGASIDWKASFWSGAVVAGHSQFDAADRLVYSQASPGTIELTHQLFTLEPPIDRNGLRRLELAHETIHTLQFDAAHEWLGHDAETAILKRSRLGRFTSRWIEPGLLGPMLAGFVETRFRYRNRPWELEAAWASEGRPPLDFR